MTDALKRNAHLVESLGAAMREGGHALGTVPALLKRVLAEESWREFVTQRGEHVEHESFLRFVVTPPLAGLGSDAVLIRLIIDRDPEAVDLFDRAVQTTHGGDHSNVDNINVARPAGTSKTHALRRLRKDAPELHADVLAGRLSAHGAMVKAGFRPRTFTVRVDSAESVAATLRRQLDPELLSKLVSLLRGD